MREYKGQTLPGFSRKFVVLGLQNFGENFLGFILYRFWDLQIFWGLKKGSRILGAARRLEFLVVFGPFWPLEVSIGTKLYNQIVQFNRTYSSIYILVPIETSSGQNGPKKTKNSNRLAAPSILDPCHLIGCKPPKENY